MATEPTKINILVFIGPHPDDAIGENLMKLPFLRGLKDKFPHSNITWMHGNKPNMFEHLLEPLVRNLIYEFAPSKTVGTGWSKLFLANHPLSGKHFQIVVDTQKNPKYTMLLKKVSHELFISSTWRYMFSDLKPSWTSSRSLSQTGKLLDLLSLMADTKVRPDYRADVPNEYLTAAAIILPSGKNYVGLAPGAGRMDTGKCWPLKNFISLAQNLQSSGLTPVFFLGPSEKVFIKEIENSKTSSVIAPLNWLLRDSKKVGGPPLTIALGTRLRVSVANCSGTGHMLAAGGSKMVSLYGPTSSKKFAPYSPHVKAIHAQDFGSNCIEVIPVGEVYKTVMSLL